MFGRADDEARGPLRSSRSDDALVAGFQNDQPRERGTFLAGVSDADWIAPATLIEVGVTVDDERVFAPISHTAFSNALACAHASGGFVDFQAGPPSSRVNANEIDARMLDEMRADLPRQRR